MDEQHDYHAHKGGLETQRVSVNGSWAVERHYEWDMAGNLTGREDALRGLTESFGYDGLYRLETVTRER